MTPLLQETWGDPWRMLVCCILANRTPGARARPVLERLFARYPTPAAMGAARPVDVARTLRPLGLHRQRARTLIRLSRQCALRLPADRRHAERYCGVGRYAADSFAIFVEGDRGVEPRDRVLAAYLSRAAPPPTRGPTRRR